MLPSNHESGKRSLAGGLKECIPKFRVGPAFVSPCHAVDEVRLRSLNDHVRSVSPDRSAFLWLEHTDPFEHEVGNVQDGLVLRALNATMNDSSEFVIISPWLVSPPARSVASNSNLNNQHHCSPLPTASHAARWSIGIPRHVDATAVMRARTQATLYKVRFFFTGQSNINPTSVSVVTVNASLGSSCSLMLEIVTE